MRGESRRCKGSMEPLRRLPDGALATRRIVSFLLRCCCGGAAQSCGPCAARVAVRARAAHQKGVQQPLTCKALQAARRRANRPFTGLSPQRVTPKMRLDAL